MKVAFGGAEPSDSSTLEAVGTQGNNHSIPMTSPHTLTLTAPVPFRLPQTMAPGQGNDTRPFYMTPESPHYASVSGYYNVPYVSVRNALWNSDATSPKGLLSTAAVSQKDGSTPTDAGHA